MKKIKQYINNLSVKRKIIFYVYVVISPIFILISTGLFLQNYKQSVNNQKESNISLIKSLEENISIIQSDVLDFSLYLCINSDISKILQSKTPQVLNKDTRIWFNKAPMQTLEDIIAIKGYIKTVAIYPENGVHPYLRCLDSSSYIFNIEQVRETDSYKESIENKGNYTWKRVNHGESAIFQANRTDKIVMYREIYDMSKKIPLGYLVMGIDAKEYIRLCESTLQDESEGIVVLSYQGDELARAGKIDDKVLEYLQSDKYISSDYRKRDIYFEYNDYIIYSVQSEKKGVIVSKIISKEINDSQFNNIALLPIILLVGLLIGLWPLLIVVSNIISNPLKRLSVAMNQFKKGDFTQRIEVVADDEIGEVTTCFNEMVEDIKLLIDKNYVITLKEKESELLALQAQINPHFLYNTLDSLYWRTINAGNEELAEDIFALSQLFRMVLGQGKGDITVEQERELIYRYLQIQKMRFLTRLDYTIEMEQSILQYDIPKLILQPFVENAIIHGLEKTSDIGSVFVTGKLKDGYIEFCVKDTGIGMSSEQIDAIWNLDESERYASQRVGRYAIKNVKERLELKYFNDYTLRIDSQIGVGTTVTIVIPAMEKVEK